jgi:PTH1 family peptidyl-tRNA hydrolase
MKLIVGLGNPGTEYENTRHNAGFLAVDEIAKRLGVSFSEKKALKGDVAEAPEPKVVLMKPDTFMNLSGEAVAAAMKKWGVSPENVLVIHDEADLAFGDVRMKTGGGTAGHNGLKSIVEHLPAGTEFDRVRVGIGRGDNPNVPLDAFVLAKWTKEEDAMLPGIIQMTADKAEEWYGK